MTSFLSLIYSIKFRLGEDNIYWNPTKSKIFEVKSFYKVFHGEGAAEFSWKSIWKVKTPSK